MACITVLTRGKFATVDDRLKECRRVKPASAVLTSFDNRTGGTIIGILLAVVGCLGMGVADLERARPDVGTLLWLSSGAVLIGILIAGWSRRLGLRSRVRHCFFAYDQWRLIRGRTVPLDRGTVRRLGRTPASDKIDALKTVSKDIAELPIWEIEHVGVMPSRTGRGTGKLKFHGRSAEFIVDFSRLLPAPGLSKMSGEIAFNDISRLFTRATGRPIEAAFEKF